MQIVIAVVFYNTPEEVITLLLYIFSNMLTTQWNLLFIFEFFNSAKNEKKVMCKWKCKKCKWKKNANLEKETWWFASNSFCCKQFLPQVKRNSRLNLSPERQLKQRYLLISATALGYWNEERLMKSLGFFECVVHLFEETINRYMAQDTIPSFTIFREMGHLRHQTSIINPCKILVLH